MSKKKDKSLTPKVFLSWSTHDENSEAGSDFRPAAFADRLRALIGEQSANGFARDCSIGESSLRQYLAGGTPGLDKVVLISQAKNVRVEWLATGRGPRDIEPKDALAHSGTEREHTGRDLMQAVQVDATNDDAVRLPLLSVEGSAGRGLIPTGEEIEDYLSVSGTYLREVGINPQHAHVLRLSGHSMYPTLQDKDLVIVDTSRRVLRDEEVYSVVFGDAVLIKRLLPLWDGSVLITSDNKNGNYPDSVVPAKERQQLRIVGRVSGFLRYF